MMKKSPLKKQEIAKNRAADILMFSNISKFKSGSYIFLNLSVKNIGSPSAVYGWHLNVKLPDGTLLLNRIPDMIPNGMKLVDKTSGKIIAQFHSDNQLVEKTIVAIQRGSFVSGWLWFKLPNLTQEQLKSSTIILYAQDIMDKEYSMKVDISKNDPNFNTNYFPGSGKNIFN
jgi:hypothetical protein